MEKKKEIYILEAGRMRNPDAVFSFKHGHDAPWVDPHPGRHTCRQDLGGWTSLLSSSPEQRGLSTRTLPSLGGSNRTYKQTGRQIWVKVPVLCDSGQIKVFRLAFSFVKITMPGGGGGIN